MKFMNIFSRIEKLQKTGTIQTIIVINRIAVGILLCCLLLLLAKLL